MKMPRVISAGVLALLSLVLVGSASANIILAVNQDSLVSTGANSWSVNLVVDLDNVGDADLTSPPKISSVNLRLFFNPSPVGLDFVDAVAPASNALFSPGSSTYGYGMPNSSSEMYASVISNVSSADPILSNGKNLMTINFQTSPTLVGTFGIQIDPDSNAGTFYTLNGGGGAPIAFDGVRDGSITVVPEPSTLALAAIAVPFVAVFTRRLARRNTGRPVN